MTKTVSRKQIRVWVDEKGGKDQEGKDQEGIKDKYKVEKEKQNKIYIMNISL